MKTGIGRFCLDLIAATDPYEALLDGTTAPVKRSLDSAAIVRAIFRDPMEEEVASLIIKGNAVLDAAAATRLFLIDGAQDTNGSAEREVFQ